MPNLLKQETHYTYTIELDERELGTIIACLSYAIVDEPNSIVSIAHDLHLPALNKSESDTLYSRLLKFATE